MLRRTVEDREKTNTGSRESFASMKNIRSFDTLLLEREQKKKLRQQQDGAVDGTASQLVFYLMNLRHGWDSIPADFLAHSAMTANNESMGLLELVCECVCKRNRYRVHGNHFVRFVRIELDAKIANKMVFVADD